MNPIDILVSHLMQVLSIRTVALILAELSDFDELKNRATLYFFMQKLYAAAQTHCVHFGYDWRELWDEAQRRIGK